MASSTKVVLITGSAQRVGATIARSLHATGCHIAIHYQNSAAAANSLMQELNQIRPDSAITIQANLLDTDNLPPLVDQVIKQWGRLDVLVNNASSFYPTTIGNIVEAAWQDLVGTNFKAPLFLAQAAAPYLKQTQGCIINMVDIHAERPMRKHIIYSAAKAALSSVSKSLARELAPEVRVNGIAPGAILWPEQTTPDQTKQAILERVALKRCGTPEDIAQAVKFLAFDAPYITGHILPVDGGRRLFI